MKIVFLFLVFVFTTTLSAQKKSNYIIIKPGTSEKDIIEKAAKITPSQRQLTWQRLELTAFFHFGVNTFTNQEWGDGKEEEKIFNPEKLDANQWIKVCKDAGIKQVIITAKHHDGFCLWPSKYTEHSVKNSPWKNGKGDVVKAVSDACKKEGIGFGVYLSPWDRNNAAYGTEAYNQYFVNQLTELLTNYGKVDEVWFDGANGEGPNGKKQEYDFERWYKVIRKLQPQATIAIMGPDIRWVGTESGRGRETEWSVVPANNLNQNAIAANSQQANTIKPEGYLEGDDLGSRDKIKNAKGLVWYPAETDVSIRPGWFYHPAEDSKVKSPETLLEIYFKSVGRNGVLLLNIPPDKEGLISEADQKALADWTALRKNIFKTNLAKGAILANPAKAKAALLFDGNDATHLSLAAVAKEYTVELKLADKKEFNVLLLQENITIGQRIENFVLEYKEGSEWKKITEGTTVGYKRLLQFGTVSANVVRLRILSSRLQPALAEFGLYYQSPDKQYSSDVKADTSYKQYVGKYIFPDGSITPNATVSIQNNELLISSSLGSAWLKRTGIDKFEMTDYDGRVIFIRDLNKLITKIDVEVNGLHLEGTKDNSETPSSALQNVNDNTKKL